MDKLKENKQLNDPAQQVVDLEERTWLSRHCRGDRSAFAKLIKAYQRPIYSYLVHSGFDAAACDDLFQEIFLKVHNAAHEYQSHLPLKPWLFTIAANTVRNRFRAQSSQPVTVSVDDFILNDPLPQPDKHLQLQDTVQWLQHAVTVLPAVQRQTLLLTAEGFKLQEVAQMLAIPLNTVKTHLRRARLLLAKALAKRNCDGETNDADL